MIGSLVCAAQSILEVFLLCCCGYVLAGKGVLDKKTQKVRARRLDMTRAANIFLPLITATKSAERLTLHSRATILEGCVLSVARCVGVHDPSTSADEEYSQAS